MQFNYDLTQYLNHPEVAEKIKILIFFDKYGLITTKDAFSVGRATLFLWKKKIKNNNGSLLGLINKSRRPYNTRRMYVPEKIFAFIKQFREDYPRLGKDKIKILLDEYCRENNLEIISESKVGRIIKKNNWYFYLGKRNTNKQVIQDKKRVFGYEVENPGDLFQVDTVVRFEHGIKRYIVTAIDVVAKFSFSYTYKSHASLNAADFAAKLIQATPYSIKAIQTDNGSEFLKDFDKTIAKLGIVHFFTYPRCPKQNGCIERFNRSLQEEFVDFNAVLLEEKDAKSFNDKLIDYLLWYNTKRPHNSLNNKPPMEVVVDYLKKSNMSWTDTRE
jgi:transposase InsO family protein